jgi:hypothetical protein
MRLYRLVTGRPTAKAYAVRNGTFGAEPIVAWSPRKGAAALFRRSEATKLARRMRRLRIQTRVEAA